MIDEKSLNLLRPLLKEDPIFINGNYYLSIKEFGRLICRSPSYISSLVAVGNGIRILKSLVIGSARLIELDEFFNFPFIRDRKIRVNGTVYIERHNIDDNNNIIVFKEACKAENLKNYANRKPVE